MSVPSSPCSLDEDGEGMVPLAGPCRALQNVLQIWALIHLTSIFQFMSELSRILDIHQDHHAMVPLEDALELQLKALSTIEFDHAFVKPKAATIEEIDLAVL